MSPLKRQKKQIVLERRKQILSAAVKIFATHGFANTKISDIASAAGLSHGLIYHYFKTKDDVFTELIKYAHNHFLGSLAYANKYDGSPLEKIRIFTDIVTPRDYSEEAAYYSNIILQAHTSKGLPKAVKKIINQNITKHNEIITSLIIEGQKLGQIIQGDPVNLAYAHYSMLCGMQVMHILIKDFPDYPISIIDSDTVIRALKNPDSKDEPPVLQKEKSRFGKIQLTDKLITYRFRENENSESKIIKTKLFETTEKGIKIYHIETEKDTGEKQIALVNAENLRPLYIEIKNANQEIISRTVYEDDSATFDIPGHKLQKTIRLHGEYFDFYTINIVFRAFPFESNDKIEFLIVYDGNGSNSAGYFAMEAQMIGEEKINVPAGEFNCYKLKMRPSIVAEDHADIYSYYFWYSVDEPHFWVKYEDMQGKLAELVKVE